MPEKAPLSVDKFKDHLEFIGYEFEQVGDKQQVWSGSHPDKPKIVIREANEGILLSALYAPITGVTADTPGFLAWINDGNAVAIVNRVFFYEKALWVETWWFAEYDKAPFARFFDRWLADLANFFSMNEAAGKKFIQ